MDYCYLVLVLVLVRKLLVSQEVSKLLVVTFSALELKKNIE